MLYCHFVSLTILIFCTTMANENFPISVDCNDNNNVFAELETSTSVWKHFTKSIDKNSAVCSLCQ